MDLWGQTTSRPQLMGLTGLHTTVWILNVVYGPLCGRLGSQLVVLLEGSGSFESQEVGHWGTSSGRVWPLLHLFLVLSHHARIHFSPTHISTMMFFLTIAIKDQVTLTPKLWNYEPSQHFSHLKLCFLSGILSVTESYSQADKTGVWGGI